MIEPSRLSPKPRFITASWVPPRVLAWVTPLMLPSASSRLRGFWSRSAWAGTVTMLCGVSSTGVSVRPMEATGAGW